MLVLQPQRTSGKARQRHLHAVSAYWNKLLANSAVTLRFPSEPSSSASAPCDFVSASSPAFDRARTGGAGGAAVVYF